METQGVYGESGCGQRNDGMERDRWRMDEDMLVDLINDFTQILSDLIHLEADLARFPLSSRDIESIRLCACYACRSIEHHIRPFCR